MRYLLILSLLIIAVGCEKDVKEVKNVQPVEVAVELFDPANNSGT